MGSQAYSTCPYTLADNPGKMRSQTYLPIHSYRQPQKLAVSNLHSHTLLPTTSERCGLNQPAHMIQSYRQRWKVAVSNLTFHTLLPSNLERCCSTPISMLLPQTLLFHLPTKPERFHFTLVSNLPAHTLTNKPGKMPLNQHWFHTTHYYRCCSTYLAIHAECRLGCYILTESSNRPLTFNRFSSKPKRILQFYLHPQIGRCVSQLRHQMV